jgi:hypothetical protein
MTNNLYQNEIFDHLQSLLCIQNVILLKALIR